MATLDPHTETPPDRRNQDALLGMVAAVLEEQRQVAKDLALHLSTETGKLKELFIAAFPGDDPSSHRRWHEADIKRIEERAEFWKLMRTETAKWGLLGFLGFAVVAIWNHFLKGPP